MSPPVNIDGTDITGATIDGQEVQEITVDGQVVFTAVPDIPDSIVSRTDDDSTVTGTTQEFGLEISLKTDYPSIGARISTNTSGATRAYLVDSNNSEIQTVDISSLSSNDAFTFDNVNLTSGNNFGIYLDAEGSTYDFGFADESNYPYTGTDIDIVGAYGKGDFSGGQQPRAVNDIGNVGF